MSQDKLLNVLGEKNKQEEMKLKEFLKDSLYTIK